jgi:hypothetical protein
MQKVHNLLDMSVAYSFDLKIQKKIHDKLMKDIDFVESQKHQLEKEITDMKSKIDMVILKLERSIF